MSDKWRDLAWNLHASSAPPSLVAAALRAAFNEGQHEALLRAALFAKDYEQIAATNYGRAAARSILMRINDEAARVRAALEPERDTDLEHRRKDGSIDHGDSEHPQGRY